MVKPSKLKVCPACGSDNVVYDKKDDELCCQDCGEVYGELAPDDEDQYEDASDVI